MNRRMESVLSILLTTSAVSVAATYVYKQVITGSSDAKRPSPSYVEYWDRLQQGGTRIGPSSAPIQIVEFGDFQCPFCGIFHSAVGELMDEFTDQVSLVFYHYPLNSHPSAVAAAQAARCATVAGRFAEMAAELFAKQDSIGSRSWSSYARSAGISDTVGFQSCMHDSSTQAAIDADRAFGRELTVQGTPTVIINGWRFDMPPTVDSLKHYVGEILNGRSPFPRRG